MLETWRRSCGVTFRDGLKIEATVVGVGSAKEKFSRMEKGLDVSMIGVGVFLWICEKIS